MEEIQEKNEPDLLSEQALTELTTALARCTDPELVSEFHVSPYAGRATGCNPPLGAGTGD